MTDSEFVQHEPCPACGSKDNLARYSDGHGHCFGCGHYEKPAGDHTVVTRIAPNKEKRMTLLQGEYDALPKRGINEETCRKWGYQKGRWSDGRPVQIANYYVDGAPVAQKVRFPSKDFKFVGDTKAVALYGQWLWRDGGKRLVITEGEIDALSVSQLFGNKWPVVSVPNGAQGAKKSIAAQVEWLESFETVVFAFDMDEPGQKAARECAALLSPGKAAIAHLPCKDANDALVQGKGKEVVAALWDAKIYRPDGVVDVESLIEKAVRPIQQGLSWPWPSLTKVTYGRRRSEVYGFGGGTGCGKSNLFKDVALHIIEKDKLPVGLLFLEEPPAHTLKVLAGKRDGVRYHVPGVTYEPSILEATVRSFAGKVYLYDHFGAMDWDTIKDKVRYMVLSLGVRDIFLDHLTALAASIEEDERKAIDKIMAELSALAQELDITLYYVSHLTTPEGKPHEEGGRVLEKHFRGSRSIAYWSHFLFGIERDKQEIDGITTLRVLKDRYTGDATGTCIGLRYDRETGRTSECEIPSKESGKAHGFTPVGVEDF